MKNRDNENEEMQQLAVRLPVSLVSRIEAHATRLRAVSPGVDVRRADALRSLLLTALEDAERGSKGRIA